MAIGGAIGLDQLENGRNSSQIKEIRQDFVCQTYDVYDVLIVIFGEAIAPYSPIPGLPMT